RGSEAARLHAPRIPACAERSRRRGPHIGTRSAPDRRRRSTLALLIPAQAGIQPCSLRNWRLASCLQRDERRMRRLSEYEARRCFIVLSLLLAPVASWPQSRHAGPRRSRARLGATPKGVSPQAAPHRRTLAIDGEAL